MLFYNDRMNSHNFSKKYSEIWSELLVIKKLYSVLTNLDLWIKYFFQNKNIFFLIGDTFGSQHCWNERLEVKVVVGDGELVVV